MRARSTEGEHEVFFEERNEVRKELVDAIVATRKNGKDKSFKSSPPAMQTDHDVKPKEGVIKATKKLLLVRVLFFTFSL